MSTEQPRILCVDDEPHVLEGLERNLFEHFDVHQATSGVDGLRVLGESEEDFAVIVSDMRMPGIDGATFLAETRKRCPDTVRVLLTGQADIPSAVAAVNEGNIFRFLCKPCDPAMLLQTLTDAADQHRLIRAERDLLENTLGGAIRALVGLIDMLAPRSSERSKTMQRFVDHVLDALEHEDAWRCRAATMLASVGHVVLPPELLDKLDSDRELSDEEKDMVASAYETAARLVEEIPRLDAAATLIRALGNDATQTGDPRLDLDLQILQATAQFERQLRKGVSHTEACRKLRHYPAPVVKALEEMKLERQEAARFLTVHDVRKGMVLDEDVTSKDGLVIARKGHQLSPTLIQRLRNFESRGINQPFRVLVTP